MKARGPIECENLHRRAEHFLSAVN